MNLRARSALRRRLDVRVTFTAAVAGAFAFAVALAAKIHEAKPSTPEAADSSQHSIVQHVIACGGGNAFGAAGGNVNYYASPSDTLPGT